eukprot:scaffold642240_cov48-Prasinocladus_malaysianus.AAC.1
MRAVTERGDPAGAGGTDEEGVHARSNHSLLIVCFYDCAAGVCALNLEAMSLMKSGHPPGGVNHFHPSLGEENVDPASRGQQ